MVKILKEHKYEEGGNIFRVAIACSFGGLGEIEYWLRIEEFIPEKKKCFISKLKPSKWRFLYNISNSNYGFPESDKNIKNIEKKFNNYVKNMNTFNKMISL